MRQTAPEYVRGQVTALGATQRALGDDPGIRHCLNRRRNGLPAPFASQREVAKPGLWDVEHKISIGEQKANMQVEKSRAHSHFELLPNLVVTRFAARYCKSIEFAEPSTKVRCFLLKSKSRERRKSVWRHCAGGVWKDAGRVIASSVLWSVTAKMSLTTGWTLNPAAVMRPRASSPAG